MGCQHFRSMLSRTQPVPQVRARRLAAARSGAEDTAVNGGRAMHDTLTKAGVKHTWSEDPGYGHDYQIWRQYFYRLTQQTFRD